MAVRIRLRRDTAANWTSNNPVLGQGEPGYETDTGKLKFGDGTTAWTSLSYYSGGTGLDAEQVRDTVATFVVATAPVTKTHDDAGDTLTFAVSDATTTTKGIVELATDGEAAASVVVQGNDSRLSNSRAPSGAAGGVLGGTYPNPSFASDMATQAELDAHTGDTTDAHAASAITNTPAGNVAATTVQAAINELDTDKSATGHGHVAADVSDFATAVGGTAVGGDLSGTVSNAQIATGAIVNTDVSGTAAIALSKLATDPLDRANHTGTQGGSSVDAATTTARGTVELATDGENAANVVVQGNDARLSNARTPTTHTHPSTDITDFAEAVDDRVNALLVAGSNVTLTYNDGANTMTIASTGGGGGSGNGDKLYLHSTCL